MSSRWYSTNGGITDRVASWCSYCYHLVNNIQLWTCPRFNMQLDPYSSYDDTSFIYRPRSTCIHIYNVYFLHYTLPSVLYRPPYACTLSTYRPMYDMTSTVNHIALSLYIFVIKTGPKGTDLEITHNIILWLFCTLRCVYPVFFFFFLFLWPSACGLCCPVAIWV